ncbi:hypothetical protein PV08_06448 [Exophiala spinifera]|uniref:Uncharacterized protein n=1 Tax=Exophiala spinifera TaxID=91928 RepID=A0A0D1YMX3_9EURO|nr:uncharacterized protein PV08_06448 [Exophiala spinifera]KIW16396.1 hypothetical protein PV08_06448 [Exophiala spinifera]
MPFSQVRSSPGRDGNRPPRLPTGLRYDLVPLSSRPRSRGPQSHHSGSDRRPLAPVPEREREYSPTSELDSDSSSDYVYGRPPRHPVYRAPSSTSSGLHCTPWIVNIETINTTHRCSDAHFFRDPIQVQPGEVGTVALPILPRSEPFGIGLSIMTLTPTMFTPGAPFSELNWPVLAAQGFYKFDIHVGHVHDSTDAPALCDGRRPTRFNSTIRHRLMPGVDLLWCKYDADVSPWAMLCTPAFEMVHMRSWADGVRNRVVGQAADMPGRVAWIEPGEQSPLEEVLYGRPSGR